MRQLSLQPYQKHRTRVHSAELRLCRATSSSNMCKCTSRLILCDGTKIRFSLSFSVISICPVLRLSSFDFLLAPLLNLCQKKKGRNTVVFQH
eukprot:m.126915 g.126915  ORF g.126915 m.126915 type:complete len:92 (-) comp19834_c0_seq2:602-877(-)